MSATSSITAVSRLVSRPFEGEADWWRVRDLLIETYPITPVDFNWEIRRWDGWRFHQADAAIDASWGARVHLWETADGRLVGAVHPDGDGTAVLELHPDYRHIEAEMLDWAEAHLALPRPDGEGRQLDVYVFDYDTPRRRLLTDRGYTQSPHGGVSRRMRLGNRPLPAVVLAAGYTLRGTRDNQDDYQGVADLLNAAFNRTFHTAADFHTFATQSPSYRADLNLVAEAPDGTFAALVGVTYDTANRRGIFEPVCTHPDHRRLGLSRALMFEGLHRLKALGATDVYVGTGDDPAANALYDAVGFTEAYKGTNWRGEWKTGR